MGDGIKEGHSIYKFLGGCHRFHAGDCHDETAYNHLHSHCFALHWNFCASSSGVNDFQWQLIHGLVGYQIP
jgi:hypothetical protein